MTTNLFELFEDSTADRYAGQRVDIARRARGITQRDLARASGIHEAGLSRKIAGRQAWSLDDLLRVAAVLDVRVSVFLEGVEDHSARPEVFETPTFCLVVKPTRHLRAVA